MSSAHNRVEVLHGVNLDSLGRRDPEHYGSFTLGELEVQIRRWAHDAGLGVSFFQTNQEGEMVEYLHRMPELADGAILNAGSWTHYSWALRDALELASVPTVEVHISDIHAREQWRRHSVFDGLVLDQISGEGADGYRRALELLAKELDV